MSLTGHTASGLGGSNIEDGLGGRGFDVGYEEEEKSGRGGKQCSGDSPKSKSGQALQRAGLVVEDLPSDVIRLTREELDGDK